MLNKFLFQDDGQTAGSDDGTVKPAGDNAEGSEAATDSQEM